MICRASKLLLFAAALAVGGLLAAKAFPEAVVGSGTSASQERAVGPVNEVVFSGSGNLTITQGDVPELTVSADDNLLPFIETETSGRRLHITTRSGYSLLPKSPLNFTLTVPYLEKVTASGSGRVKIEQLTSDTLSIRLSGSGKAAIRDLTCKNLSVTITGSGTATATGTADKVTIRVSGSGDLDAATLKSATGDVQVSGSGTVAVWSMNDLKARVSGSGDIRYKGAPQLDKRVSGSGSIRRSDR